MAYSGDRWKPGVISPQSSADEDSVGMWKDPEAPLCLQLSVLCRSCDPFLPGGEKTESDTGPLCIDGLRVGKKNCAEYLASPSSQVEQGACRQGRGETGVSRSRAG